MVESIRLQQLRSYKDASFEFEPGVNIIVGPNASGKTNLLESILVAARTKSYKGNDKDLIMLGKDWARIDAQINQHQRTIKLELINSRLTKTSVIDNKDYKRLPYNLRIPVVLFEPNHLRILTGSPENRRNFFDAINEQLSPMFAEKLRRYQRTLAQRNALLKQRGSQNELFVWNVRLSELAQYIAESRVSMVTQVNTKIQKLYRNISGHNKASVELVYNASCNIHNYSSNMLTKLENSHHEELTKGYTVYGPHRDDFGVILNGQNSNVTASRGETRTLLLAIKIIELELVEQATGMKPLLLLDDVFSELDGARRQALTKQISTHQTFITTTDADVVVQHFMDNCHIIPLGN